VSDYLSQSTCLEMLHPKIDEHLNPSVELHHLVGKLSTAETLPTEVQRKVSCNKCNQGKNLCSPCITDPYALVHFRRWDVVIIAPYPIKMTSQDIPRNKLFNDKIQEIEVM